MTGEAPPDADLTLWDWRRRIGDLYGQVRARSAIEGWATWRDGRRVLFGTHPQSPTAATGRRLPDLFDYDPALRFVVGTEPAGGPEIPAEAGVDGAVRLAPMARTRGLATALGRELTLYWIVGYGGGVFLPFADATRGRETYGGGRYLLDTIKGADLGQDEAGRVILDFNFAYNPSCAYSDRWTCPLSPSENRLFVAIRAGEKTPIPAGSEAVPQSG